VNSFRIPRLLAFLCVVLPLVVSLPEIAVAQTSNASPNHAVGNVVLAHGAWATRSNSSPVMRLNTDKQSLAPAKHSSSARRNSDV
jgi:hypothetical protein